MAYPPLVLAIRSEYPTTESNQRYGNFPARVILLDVAPVIKMEQLTPPIEKVLIFLFENRGSLPMNDYCQMPNFAICATSCMTI